MIEKTALPSDLSLDNGLPQFDKHLMGRRHHGTLGTPGGSYQVGQGKSGIGAADEWRVEPDRRQIPDHENGEHEGEDGQAASPERLRKEARARLDKIKSHRSDRRAGRRARGGRCRGTPWY